MSAKVNEKNPSGKIHTLADLRACDQNDRLQPPSSGLRGKIVSLRDLPLKRDPLYEDLEKLKSGVRELKETQAVASSMLEELSSDFSELNERASRMVLEDSRRASEAAELRSRITNLDVGIQNIDREITDFRAQLDAGEIAHRERIAQIRQRPVNPRTCCPNLLVLIMGIALGILLCLGLMLIL